MMKRVILTIGYMQTGKTTWARSSGFPIVSLDAMRRILTGASAVQPTSQAWLLETAKLFTESLHRAGHDVVVVDYLNLNRAHRDPWQSPKWELFYKRFKGPEHRPVMLAKCSRHMDAAKAQAHIETLMTMWQEVEADENISEWKLTE